MSALARRGAARLALLCGASASCFAVGLDHGLQIYDEGLIAVGAWRVAGGELPIADFWTLYAPGAFWWNGALFAVFGVELLVLRVAHAAALLAFVLAVYALVKRSGAGERGALVAWGLATLWCAGIRTPYGYPVIPALALASAALWLLQGAVHAGDRVRAFAGGALLGCACVFRHELGIAFGVAITAWLALLAWHQSREGLACRSLLRCWLRVCVGAGAVVLLGFGPLLVAAGPKAVMTALIEFPLEVYPRVRSSPAPLPFAELLRTPASERSFDLLMGELAGLVVMASLVLAPWLLWSSAVRLRRGTLSLEGAALQSGLALFDLAFGSGFAVRSAPLVQGWALGALGIPVALLVARGPSAAGGFGALMRGSAAALCAMSAATSLYHLADLALERFALPTLAVNLPHARWLRLAADQAPYLRLIQELRTLTRPGDCIHSGQRDHDRPHANDVMLYLLSDRCVPHAYQELHPGVSEDPAVQREIAASLAARRVELVVLLDLPQEASAPVSLPADLLDAAIEARYPLLRYRGVYSLRTRAPSRDLPQAPQRRAPWETREPERDAAR